MSEDARKKVALDFQKQDSSAEADGKSKSSNVPKIVWERSTEHSND